MRGRLDRKTKTGCDNCLSQPVFYGIQNTVLVRLTCSFWQTFLRQMLQLLDAQKHLGLTVTPEHILIPRKSVTALIGLSAHPLKKGARGCATCRMRETCAFRKGGAHC